MWTADFKGEFRLAHGPYCYPLTLSDLCSRYVLTVTALLSTATEPATAQFRRCFTTYGLPRVIRTDNGVPFGAPGALGGLSPLAVWWIRLGIRPERIDRGVPQQNGAHERMHRTLKAETTRPPSATLELQHQRFERWRRTFNTRRPHEALGNTPPRPRDTSRIPAPILARRDPAEVELRRVPARTIHWRTTKSFPDDLGEYVSLRETADDEWTIAFGPLTLGIYSAAALAFHEALAWTPGT